MSTQATPPTLDETHDPALRCWVESANDPATDFPIQNLPFAMMDDGTSSHSYVCTVIGDRALNLHLLQEHGLFPDLQHADLYGTSLNDICALSAPERTAIRRRLSRLLRAENSELRANADLLSAALVPLKDIRLTLPAEIGNYTDFYASIHHATTVGSMFRPDNPLLPNYKWVPIGYHGRASSIVVSGESVRRPHGQTKADDAAAPTFGPCRMLDYELEVGALLGPGNAMGETIPVGAAHQHLVGLTIVNDWSARDMQKWEYQPLGPFLAKNFATTVSPCIVTLDALEPFRCAAYRRPAGDPAPLPYLHDAADQARGGFDITLEVRLQSADMAARGLAPVRISSGRAFKDMYWTFAQMLAHHTSNGCNIRPGDLIASGTVSGLAPDERGCLLELTWDGPGKPRKAIELPTGEKRTFLADGDTVIITAFCERDGFRRIGFGECRGRIVG